MVLWRQTNIFYLIMTLHLLLNIMGPKRRCSIKSYALKSRYLGLTVQEKRKASNYRRWIRQLIIIQAVDGTGAEAAELEEVTEIIILMCIKLTRERSIPRISTPRLNRTIESISVIEISDSFRFRIIELFKSSRCPKIFEKIIQEKSFFLGTSWGVQKNLREHSNDVWVWCA